MSSFICHKCGCIDNSAMHNNFWMVKTHPDKNNFKDDYYNKHLVCEECMPIEYINGEPTGCSGEWHNRFDKRHWTDIGDIAKILEICDKGNGSYVNAREYFVENKLL